MGTDLHHKPIDPSDNPRTHTASGALSLGVLICTCRRPDHLARCLEALAAQTRLPDDIIVVLRADDTATLVYLGNQTFPGLPIRIVIVAQNGVVRARNVGLDACRTDILAQIDDDTAPHPNWCALIVGHFAEEPTLGGLGGRDRVHDGQRFDEKRASCVGILQWHGRDIGNHHRGFGAPRPVHFLKGANMTFRAKAFVNLRFDIRLRGSGAEPHEDLAFSLAVRRQGWSILYDPDVVVDHFAARAELRPYSTVGVVGDSAACRDSAFNMVIALWDELSLPRKLVFIAWSILIGSGPEPGLLQAVRYTFRTGWMSWWRFAFTQRGKMAAVLLMIRTSATSDRKRRMRHKTPLACISAASRQVCER